MLKLISLLCLFNPVLSLFFTVLLLFSFFSSYFQKIWGWMQWLSFSVQWAPPGMSPSHPQLHRDFVSDWLQPATLQKLLLLKAREQPPPQQLLEAGVQFGTPRRTILSLELPEELVESYVTSSSQTRSCLCPLPFIGVIVKVLPYKPHLHFRSRLRVYWEPSIRQ